MNHLLNPRLNASFKFKKLFRFCLDCCYFNITICKNLKKVYSLDDCSFKLFL